MKILVFMYEKCKFETEAQHGVKEVKKSVIYDNVTNVKILGDKQSFTAIEEFIDEKSKDPFHEYLQIEFEDGSFSTFRSSYADAFVIEDL